MREQELRWLRLSLVAVWIFTALVSVWEWHGQSRLLLLNAGLGHPVLVAALVWGGAAADLALGLAMLWRPSRWVYALALVLMVVMTLLATVLLPELWLHPLGPLSKNIPLGVMLWILALHSPRSSSGKGARTEAAKGDA
ncbi:DoxX-like family protein [Rhodoferax aquaticus]|nr:DoxX-like family protein [Rhodoferax aquaticus]